MGLEAHCVLDVLVLCLDRGMLWACHTTESNPGQAVAIETFFCVDSLVPYKGCAHIQALGHS